MSSLPFSLTMDDAMTAHRVNLRVEYRHKDAAKALGARWDQELRTWWATTEQCEKAPGLLRWVGEPKAQAVRQEPSRPAPKQHVTSKPKLTEQRLFSLASCCCQHVAPWEDCEHTDPMMGEPELDEHQRSHMEYISGRIAACR